MIGTEEESTAILEACPPRLRIQLSDPLNEAWAEVWLDEAVTATRGRAGAIAKRRRKNARRLELRRNQ